jgi:prepilin signal peptidase PulO-like enzyme (type II secretory pathway)
MQSIQLYSHVAVFILGLAFGSFALATAWRIRKKKNFTTDTSECEHCHHKLAAKDLVPLASWLLLRGKCRYCNKKISRLLPAAELTGGIFFLTSFAFWPDVLDTPLGYVRAALWACALVLLLILFFYDLQWYLLPNKLMYPLWSVAFIDAILRLAQTPTRATGIAAVFAVAVAAGLFYVFYEVSRGAWIGFGDVRLGVAIGLLLGSPWLAGLALFTASLVGILASLPSMLLKKKSLKSKVPFGPLLIIGLIVARLWGADIIDWYAANILLLG